MFKKILVMEATHVQEDPDRQSGRDRLPSDQDRPQHGRRDGGGVFGGRRQRAPRAPGRRSGADRTGRGTRVLPRGRAHPRGREEDRRRSDPPRLRLPVGERRVRRSLRSGRHCLHRPAGFGHPRHGLEVCCQGADGTGRGAADARLPRRQPGPCVPGRPGRAHRLPGADQGQRRRRRQGHAPRRRCRRFRGGIAVVQARGEQRLRQRPRAGREVRAQAATHRDPGVRRQARQLRLPVRARLLGAAQAPEGARGGACPRHDARAPRRDGQGGGGRRQGGRLRRRRHGGIHRQPGRQLLLHGDEHAAAGRAPGDRDDHRARPGRVAAAGGQRRAPAAARRSNCRSTATRSRPASTPRIPTRASCPRPAGSCTWRHRPKATMCAWTPASSRATRSRRTTTR